MQKENVTTDNNQNKRLKKAHIPVRILEAYFYATKNLIRYTQARSKMNDFAATMALSRFVEDTKRNIKVLDLSEILFSFMAFLIKNNISINIKKEEDKAFLAELMVLFCDANSLGLPETGYANKIIFPKEKFVKKIMNKYQK